jgi:hypothetical protein
MRRAAGDFHIERYVPIRLDRVGDRTVTVNNIAYREFKDRCRDEGFEYGTIHTHIVCDSAPTTPDLVGADERGESLIGVMEIEKRKERAWSRIDFWLPATPCRVNLIKEK